MKKFDKYEDKEDIIYKYSNLMKLGGVGTGFLRGAIYEMEQVIKKDLRDKLMSKIKKAVDQMTEEAGSYEREKGAELIGLVEYELKKEF